ncbi:MAG: RNA-directed DNA polymerase [Acidobacteria bacterium]|nr:RNA-directed DNA polymerase [Acidobacteriota bacterium]
MNEKARLYQRITSEMNEETVLARMRMHGFWPASAGVPPDPPEEVKDRQRIEKEIARLAGERKKAADPEKALAQERNRRIEESRKRRAELKEKRAAEREARQKEWAAFRERSVVHAGTGVSAGLETPGRSSLEELVRRGLPMMHDGQDLARWLGITIGKLRWLTYHRNAAALVHYHRFGIPKKSGGIRAISAPKASLAVAQRWILTRILSRLTPDDAAHGFVHGRSIVSNAAPHAGRRVVINMDMKDFFPTVTFRRVKGLFRRLGYNEPVAVLLALLCTEPPRVAAELGGKAYFIALSSRTLPQGACTSPAITNAVCHRLDRRLTGLAARHGFTYTRYADDLTFSGDDATAVGRLLRSIQSIAGSEGFVPHPEKTRVMRRGERQEVTGVTVNDKVGVSRREVRELRAILCNAARLGLATQNREAHPDFAGYLRGRVAYVAMVDPSKKSKLEAALARALEART